MNEKPTFEELEKAARLLISSAFDSSDDMPAPTDTLFTESKKYWPWNSIVEKYDGREVYNHGYLTAAKLLARTAIYSRGMIDFLIYPIVFLYRHSLEIKMKSIISECWSLRDDNADEPTDKLNRTHDLKYLCELLVSTLKASKLISEGDELSLALHSYAGLVQQIQQIDPKADAFRYSRTNISKDTEKTSESLTGTDKINILNFCVTAEKMTTALETIEFNIWQENEHRNDLSGSF